MASLLPVTIVLLGCSAFAHSQLLNGFGMQKSLTKFFDSVLSQRQSDDEGQHWALLIAGSAGYGNYRHQADVAHAYQIMKSGGLKDENIVVMMADDVAFNYENPHPGELYNRPGGPNVYQGLKPDYQGFKVNANNFLAVLAGNQSGLDAPAAGGKVIASGPNDLVFVYYADHGAPGILGMPWGPFLYADQLISTLEGKAKRGEFKEMVMFIEACESGSMFEGLLNAELPIYVTTAANAHESSWGTYCPGMSPSPPPEYTTCLGDLYSVAWLEEVDALASQDALDEETLKQLYKDVKQRTSNNFTYTMGSHVMQYGNLNISTETLGTWMEDADIAPSSLFSTLFKRMVGGRFTNLAQSDEVGASEEVLQAVEARDAELLHLISKASRLEDGPAKDEALQAVQRVVEARQAADIAVRAAVNLLLTSSNAGTTLTELFPPLEELPALATARQQWLVEAVVTTAPPSHQNSGTAVVSDWECYRGMVAAWEDACGPMDGYSMKYARALANLCNAGITADTAQAALSAVCVQPQSA